MDHEKQRNPCDGLFFYERGERVPGRRRECGAPHPGLLFSSFFCFHFRLHLLDLYLDFESAVGEERGIFVYHIIPLAPIAKKVIKPSILPLALTNGLSENY